ncbi:sigma-70 family RNA polymerase sigma factor [Actinotalea fermentans]|uniref:RNA polymerase sigma factor n=1 Tax=Actinotalea fermentans TaxID=43671 RepID=A0A511YYW0_9CELL|nr:sigma-70 family RNA polymerase sigma factor [Actinotalea fermentans]KGM16110.1 RNA polymerase sigma factor [Actinotalea fermentans ATCC 43279 = JCM 9966 = DSM 3133]GEN80391.1 RNA polymerase sigma factor [Actinotalea fermentans]
MTATATDRMVELHGEHARALWAFALRLVGGDRARAEDVVQETLLRAWRDRTVLESTTAGARAWLFTVARRLVIDEWRSSRAHREVLTAELPEPATDDPATTADGLVLGWLVADALARLSTEHRQVLVLCYFGGRSVADAAAELGVPPGTVKSRTHYALRSLRLVLEEMGVTR